MGVGISCCQSHKEDKLLVTKLDLSHCGCTEVPNMVFNAERCIETLNLSSNQITSLPPQLFHCQELKHISLVDNCLDCIPPAIGSLLHLISLKIDKNSVHDLPDSLKACKKLKRLSLTHNPWRQLPSVVTQLISLEELYLSDCELGYLPASVGRLSKLKILELRNNSLCGLPLSLSRLSALTRLDVGDNELTEFPACISSLSGLTELMLDNNDIETLGSLENLQLLQHLDVSYNHLATITDTISSCPHLVMLNLSFNYIETLPESIGTICDLQTLLVEMNELSELPRSIGQLSTLEELNLSNNRLYSVPSSIGLLRNLTNLNLAKNLIEELPPELGSCVSLTVISLGYNRLQVLPSEIGYLNNLRVLDLVGNFLTYLPMTMMKLGSVRAIWLSANQNVPLIPFTEELDLANGERYLTNIALPQLGEIPLPPRGPNDDKVKPVAWTKKIRFAEDEDILPGKLHRTPTPFPKELRAPNRKQHVRSGSSDYVDSAALVLGVQNVAGKQEDETTMLLSTVTARSDLLNFTEGACVSRIREASIVKSREKEDNSSGKETQDDTRHSHNDSEEAQEQSNMEEPDKKHQTRTQQEEVQDQVQQQVANQDQVIYSNLIDQQQLQHMDPQSVRQMYHNDIIFDSRRASTANSETSLSKIPSRNGIYGPEPHQRCDNSEMQQLLQNERMRQSPYLYNGHGGQSPGLQNGQVSQSPGLDNRNSYELYEQTDYQAVHYENGNVCDTRSWKPDLIQSVRQSPQSLDNGNVSVGTGGPPRGDVQRVMSLENGYYRHSYDGGPPSKREMAELTERMRSKHVAPPCYEIAKMYSTKAALFERHHHPPP